MSELQSVLRREGSMTPVQLLLVDDHMLFRESLRRLLTVEADFDVVGDCGTTSEARTSSKSKNSTGSSCMQV